MAGQHHYDFGVTMTCTGCSGAIEKVLGRLDGIQSYTVSLPDQTAKVTTAPESSLDYDTLLEKIKKTGKKVNSGKADGVEMAV